MGQFKDRRGRVWSIELNVTALQEVKAACDLDLLEALQNDGRVMGELAGNPVRLVQVICVLVSDQLDWHGVSEEDFGRALGGDVIAEAIEALVEGIIDFFPSARNRETLRAIWNKMRAAQDRLEQIAGDKVAEIDETAAAEAWAQQMFGGSSTGTPGSSASIPGL